MGESQNLGIVAPLPQGEWQSGQTYQKLSVVSHLENVYMAKVDNAVEPGVGTNWQNYWMLLVQSVPIKIVRLI